MTESIPVSVERIAEIISTLPQERFSTSDVIRKYNGTFCSNQGTPAAYSFNAQFGRLLKRNEDVLDIKEIESNVPTEDDHGIQTSTSYWRRSTQKLVSPER